MSAERRGPALPLILLAGAVAALLCWRAHGAEPPATDQVSIGAGAVLSERADVVPVAIIAVDAPVFLGSQSAARIYAAAKLHGTPGATLDPTDVATFNGAELDLFIQRRIGADRSGASTYLHVQGGGAVRRDSGDDRPALRTPLWWAAGVTLERRAGNAFPHRRLSLGFGHSDLSSPPARQPTTLAAVARDAVPRDIIVSGHVTVTAIGGLKAIIGIDAHRALWGARGTQMVRITTTATWGRAS